MQVVKKIQAFLRNLDFSDLDVSEVTVNIFVCFGGDEVVNSHKSC